MEKDYFKDRSYACTENNLLRIGDIVYICEKQNQKTAKTINDLTKGVIVQKLTSVISHPRGIKVKIKKSDNTFAIGRVTYLCDENEEPLYTYRS